jgi:N-acetylneuraminic acid mutarotase
MAFIYMPDRQQGLLFGGQGISNGYFNDTWSWKDGCWTQLSPTNNPPAMSNLAIAYDAPRSTVLLWGQHNVNGWVAETWLWNSQDWRKSTTPAPPGYVAVAAYDPNIQRVVLFDSWSNETWTWDGSQWQKVSPAHEPGGRYGASMTFDPATKSLLLFGGQVRYPKVQFPSDTWLWNGSDWARLSSVTSPPGRADLSLVSYSAGTRVLLFGGQNEAILSDAWTWDGKNWSPVGSFGISGGAGAIDTGTRVFVFGGWTDKQTSDAMRSWDGASWALQ